MLELVIYLQKNSECTGIHLSSLEKLDEDMIFPNIELRIVFQDEDAEYDLNENYSASGSCPFSSICVTDVKDRFKAMLLAALWNALRGRRAPCRLRRPRGGRARRKGSRNVASGMRVAAHRRGAQIVTNNPQKK